MPTFFGSWISDNWLLVGLTFFMIAVIFLVIRLQTAMRDTAASEIRRLIASNPTVCLERLENNKRLKWLFRKPVLLLWKLDCAMALGEDGKARQTISQLRKLKLEPQDKVELYQKEISFFSTSGDGQRAIQARDDLKKFLKEAGADKVKHYASILDEADIIIGVYVTHDTGLIKKLIGRAEHTKNDIMRGVIQYRIAKLAWFKEDATLMQTYLNRASKNLKGTLYEPIIAEAMTDPRILEQK